MSQPLAHESTEHAPPHSGMSCGSMLQAVTLALHH